jgi:hypothetical protein
MDYAKQIKKLVDDSSKSYELEIKKLERKLLLKEKQLKDNYNSEHFKMFGKSLIKDSNVDITFEQVCLVNEASTILAYAWLDNKNKYYEDIKRIRYI